MSRSTRYSMTVSSIVLFSLTSAFTQSNTFSSTHFLATARDYSHLKLHQSALGYLRRTNHELPILKELEFRTETNDFKVNQQEYVLRFDFSTAKERMAQRDFHQSTVDYYSTKEAVLLEGTLERRYKKLVNLYYKKRLIAARKQQQILYQDKLYVLQQSIQTTDFDIDELIKTEEDLAELEQELLELQFDTEQLGQYVQQQLSLDSIRHMDTSTWINVAVIQQQIEESSSDSIILRPILDRRQAKIQQIQKEYELEKAQNQNLINYGQVKFGGNDDQFQERISLGIGILLPLKNANLLDLNELELEQIEASNQLMTEKDDIQQDVERTRAKLNLYLRQYQLLQSQIKDNQTAYTLEQYKKIEGISPLSLLKLQELLLKKEWTILKIEHQLFQSYIKWLALSGRMVELPLRNYLSRDLEVF